MFVGLQEATDNLFVFHPLVNVNWFPLQRQLVPSAIDGTKYEIICAYNNA